MANERRLLRLRRRDELWQLEAQCDAKIALTRRSKVVVIPHQQILAILRAAGVRMPGDAELLAVDYIVGRKCLGVRLQSQSFPEVPDGEPLPCMHAVLEKYS